MKNKGKLLIISGPSGCGKSTVISKLMEKRNDIEFSVSATTRNPRPGEEHGKDYFFVTREQFQNMIQENKLLEHAEFVGNCYGTPKDPVMEKLERGVNVILDIEVLGAAQVKKAMPEAVSIFLAPPSLQALEERLRGRGTEDESTILARLKTAEQQMACADSYDHLVVNDIVQRAADELDAIIG